MPTWAQKVREEVQNRMKSKAHGAGSGYRLLQAMMGDVRACRVQR